MPCKFNEETTRRVADEPTKLITTTPLGDVLLSELMYKKLGNFTFQYFLTRYSDDFCRASRQRDNIMGDAYSRKAWLFLEVGAE